MPETQDDVWLDYALKLAKYAAEKNEVPVGAVLVLENEIIGEGYNQPIATNDPTAHAEIIALRQGARKVGNYRLPNTTLYVTLEPCAMCAGALVHARIKRLVYGAMDQKAGAVYSALNVLDSPFVNHKVDWQHYPRKDCVHVLQHFFSKRR